VVRLLSKTNSAERLPDITLWLLKNSTGRKGIALIS
jgi:hypothetical protein